MDAKSANEKKDKVMPNTRNRDHDNIAARLVMPSNPDIFFARAARYVVKTGNVRFSSLRDGCVPLAHAARVMQQLQQAGIISKEQPYTVIVRDIEALEKALARL